MESLKGVVSEACSTEEYNSKLLVLHLRKGPGRLILTGTLAFTSERCGSVGVAAGGGGAEMTGVGERLVAHLGRLVLLVLVVIGLELLFL